MYKSQHLSQFFQKKKLWYNPSNRMYFDSRHCINISPDIFTDIQKKNTHKNPPRNIDSHRQNIDVHTENASNLTDLTNKVYTGTSNRSPFCETGPPNKDVSWCQHSPNQPVNSSSNRKCLAYGTGSVIYWPGENTRPRDHKAISDLNQTFSQS